MNVRGRPRSASNGAWKAICSIRDYLAWASLTPNAWAVRIGQTPSSVHRALTQTKEGARWTPTLKALYRIAENPEEARAQHSTVTKLTSVPPPQGEVVQRILRDLEELVTLTGVAGQRRGGRRR